jgi:hypothetical protein
MDGTGEQKIERDIGRFGNKRLHERPKLDANGTAQKQTPTFANLWRKRMQRERAAAG